jgi:hypothetical protein
MISGAPYPMVTIEPPMPTFMTDFLYPYNDIIHTKNIPNTASSAITIYDGTLEFITYPDDVIILHEAGHLLTLPAGQWYRWNTTSRFLDYHFRMPKTQQGVDRLLYNELAACGIEHTLYAHYYYDIWHSRTTSFIADICRNVRTRYAPQSHEWRLNHQEIECIYETCRVPFGEILLRWDQLMTELRLLRQFFVTQRITAT